MRPGVRMPLRMRITLSSLIAVLLWLPACSTTPRTEQNLDLGFGFRQVTMSKPSQSSFESITHLQYLYFHDRQLCELGACSVSPSGRYAIYQDATSGGLFLFSPADGSPIQLAQQFLGLVDRFEWHEEAKIVQVHFASERGLRTFVLR